MGDIPLPLVLFDGECGFCNRWVVWCLRKDQKRALYFSSNRSEVASSILDRFGLHQESLKTILVFDGERIFSRSEAILFILDKLDFPRMPIALAKLVPLSILNLAYRVIARYRFLIFGRVSECALLSDEQMRQLI